MNKFKDKSKPAPKPTLMEEPVMEITGTESHDNQPEVKKHTPNKFAVIAGAPMVNLRQGASATDKVITILSEGDKVVTFEAAGEWTEVDYEGKHGYVMSRYLKEV